MVAKNQDYLARKTEDAGERGVGERVEKTPWWPWLSGGTF